MATEKQIAANRANAKRSTGPKTLAGKQKASRNAYRHGLSHPLPIDPLATTKVDAIIQALVEGDADGRKTAAARELAVAQLELLRIRKVRADMLGNIDITSTDALHRLLSIDRYEILALRKRQQASKRL